MVVVDGAGRFRLLRRRQRRLLRDECRAGLNVSPPLLLLLLLVLLLLLLLPLLVALSSPVVEAAVTSHSGFAAAFCHNGRVLGAMTPRVSRQERVVGTARVLGMMAGPARKRQKKEQEGGLFSLRFPTWGKDDGKKRGGGGRKVKQEGGFPLFGGIFGGSSAAGAAPRANKSKRSSGGSAKKTKGKGGVGGLLAGFLDFNSEWKGQLSLQRRIKKLEKEVAGDYVRGDRAKAAQYRYEVLRTLEEVQSTVAGAEDAVLMNGPTDKGKVLDRKDARVLRRNAEVLREAEAEAGGPLLVKPEDLDSLLQQMEAAVRDEQQWARLASACVGAAVGLAAFPSHDFFGVVAAALVTTFLTTRPGLVGDAARMSGFAVVSLFKALSTLERRFEVLRRFADVAYDALEASVPFPLPQPWREAPSWRNAYRGEGFLHPDLRPAPPLRNAQYVEYLREVKRWLEAEETAVLEALKKKEDDRVQDQLEREARRQQVEKALSGLWALSSTAAISIVGAAADGILRAGNSGEGEEEGVVASPGLAEEEGGGSSEGVAVVKGADGGFEEDVEFLRKFRKLMKKRRLRAAGEEEDEEEEHEEDIFYDDAQLVDASGQGGDGLSPGGGEDGGDGAGLEGGDTEGPPLVGGSGVMPMDSNGA